MDKRSATRQLLYILLLLNVHGLCGQRSSENYPNSVSSEENQAEDYSTLQPVRRKVHREDHELIDPKGPPDHAIPYSEHEEPRDVPTRPKYVKPGLWAKPKKDVPLDFVPTKLYAQVRGTHTVKRLPKSEAIKSAETDDEKENAARLREVVTNSKVNTIYTEEGYEDSAYDHAGQIRDADFEEDFAKKRRDKLKAERGSSVGSKFRKKAKKANLGEEDDYKDYSDHLDADAKTVTLDGINRLEKDLQKEDDEAQKYADNYEALNIRNSYEQNNYDEDRSKSAESGNEPDYEGTKRSQVFGMKVKVSTPQPTNLRKAENAYKERHEPTGKDANLQSREIDSTTPDYQSFVDTSSLPAQMIDQSTFHYVPPLGQEHINDEQSDIAPPTTLNYGQLVWDYFKAKQEQQLNAQPYTQGLDGTTMTGDMEGKNSAASTTLHAPYRLAQEELTTSDPNFFPQNYHLQLQGQTLSQPENLGYLSTIESLSPYVTVQPFSANTESWTPLEVRQVDPIPEFSLTTNNFQDVFPNAPTESPIIQPEIVSAGTESESNPFLTPLLRNSYASAQSKPRYKVLVRHKPKKSSRTPDSPKSLGQESDQNSSDDFSRNKRVNGFPSRDGESSLEGFTVMRPPPLAQMRDAYSSSPADHSSANPIVIGQPSVSPEKGFPQEGNWKSSRSQYRSSHNLASDPGASQSTLPQLTAAQLTRKRNALPATVLLPPSPRVNDEYAKYNQVNGKGSSGYGRNIDRLMKYAPIIFDLDRKSRGLRRKRSVGVDRLIAEGDVKGEISFGSRLANNGESDKSLEGERTTARSRRARKGEPVKRRNYAARGLGSLSKHEVAVAVAVDGESGVGSLGKKDGPKEVEAGPGDNVNAIESAINAENEGRSGERTAPREEVSLESRPNSRKRRKSRAKSGSHDELLNRAPKIAGSVVEQEIQTRFNEQEENHAGNEHDERQMVEVEVPDFDYVEELAEQDIENASSPPVAKVTVDTRKYPFYNDATVPESSPLKYVTNPDKIPKKTPGGMEFYESRDAYKQCDEVEPSLDEVMPDEEEPVPSRGPKENLPRLRGLGDKLDCLKGKYFDDDPFDNPFFSERISTIPYPPPEINPEKFIYRILQLPDEDHGQISQRLTKKPERKRSRKRTVSNSGRMPDVYRAIRIEGKNQPHVGRIYLHTVRQSKPSRSPAQSLKNQRQKVRFQTVDPTTNTPYHRQVYDDVMGNIRSLANSYDHDATTVIPMNHAPSVNSNEHLDTLNVSAFSREKITLVPLIDPIGSRMHGNVSIKGLVPPPLLTEAPRSSYRRIRHLSKPRARPINLRYFGNIQKIRIYKRSVLPKTSDLVTDESRESRAIKELTTILEPDHELNESSHLDDLKRGEMADRIYTVRDRIRYSRPKENERNFGKFLKDSDTSDVGARRKEPRYNLIRRTKARQNATIPSLRSNETASSAVPSITERSEMINESRLTKIEQVPDILRLGSELRANKTPVTQTQTTTQNAITYAVHESLEEGIGTTPVSTNLETDSEKHSAPSSIESESRESAGRDSAESIMSGTPKPIEENTKEEEDDRSRSIEYSNESNEESPAKLEEYSSSKESESKESGSAEYGKTFFRSTPYYREKKRNTEKSVLSPSFFKSLYLDSSEDASASEEDKRTDRYVFPWDRAKDDDDEETAGRSTHYSTSIDYEYPWERRDRLARERHIRRKQSKRDGLKSLFKDDDDDDTRSKRRSYVYPWDRYEVPSKDHVNSGSRLRRKRIFDNEQTSSENRPVSKFSSRYNLNKMKLSDDAGPSADNDTKTGGAEDVSSSTFSVLSSVAIFNSTTETPTTSSIGNYRRIFGGIVPENITPAPKRTSRKNRMLLNSKSKLNNLLKSTDVSVLNESTDVIKAAQQNPVVTFDTSIATDIRAEQITTAVPDFSTTTDQTQNRHRRRKIQNNSAVKPTTAISVETSSESIKANRGRGRSRFSTTTTAATGITYTTTASPRVIRRRPKPSNSVEQKPSNIKSTTKSPVTEAPLRKTTERRSRILKEHIVTKSSHPREKSIAENSTIPHRLKIIPESNVRILEGKRKEDRLVKYEKSRVNPILPDLPDYSDVIRKINDGGVSEYKDGWSSFESAKDDESFNSKEIDPFGSSIPDSEESLKSDQSLDEISPSQQKVVQLTQHGTRNIVSSVSWVSENYDY